MLITTPQIRMKFNESEDDFLLNMHTDTTNYYFDNRNAVPTEQQYIDATCSMIEMTDIDFSVEQVKDLLSLYPHSRINLAVNGAARCSEDLSFAVAHFLLGCKWPTYGDNIDIDKFIKLMQKQAKNIFPHIHIIEEHT